jgi:hypothetical protein
LRRRPWFIVLIAALHVFAPIANLIIQFGILGFAPLVFLQGLRETGILEIYRYYLLMPVAGIAIYAMKRWSYPVFFGSWFWCIGSNYLSLRETLASRGEATFLPAGREMSSLILNFVLIVYFVLPRVRAAYYMPHVRWWEHQPRYLTNGIGAAIRWNDQLFSGELENLSLTGIKLRGGLSTSPTFGPGECIEIAFEALGGKYQVKGKIIRMEASGAMGILLLHTTRSRAQFKALTRRLRAAQYHRQSLSASLSENFQDFVAWVKTLPQWRESLLPQLPRVTPEKD